VLASGEGVVSVATPGSSMIWHVRCSVCQTACAIIGVPTPEEDPTWTETWQARSRYVCATCQGGERMRDERMTLRMTDGFGRLVPHAAPQS